MTSISAGFGMENSANTRADWHASNQARPIVEALSHREWMQREQCG